MPESSSHFSAQLHEGANHMRRWWRANHMRRSTSAYTYYIYIYIWSHGVERNRQHIQAAQNCYTDNTTSSQPCNKIKETTSHMLQSLRLHIYDNTYNKTYTQLQKNNSRKVPADIESLRRKYHQYLTRKTHKKIPKADPGSKTFQHNLDIPRAYSFSLSQ